MLAPVATAFPKDPTGSVIVNWSLASPKNLKRIHLIRHGQAEHNVAALTNPNAYKDEKYFDCSLTKFGEEQATKLGEKLKAQPPEGFPVDLVVTSPLRRTLQTATTIFETYSRGNSNAGSAAPMIAHELCREGLGYLQECTGTVSILPNLLCMCTNVTGAGLSPSTKKHFPKWTFPRFPVTKMLCGSPRQKLGNEKLLQRWLPE